MASTTITALLSAGGALDQDTLSALSHGEDQAVAYLAGEAIQILYGIESAERAARQHLAATASRIAQATANLDDAKQDTGSWVAHYANLAATEMAKVQELAQRYTTLTRVLTASAARAAAAPAAAE